MAEDMIATRYRLVLPDHVRPSGVREEQMLDEVGFQVDDRNFGTRADAYAPKDGHGVAAAPRTIITGKLIGGSEELGQYLACG